MAFEPQITTIEIKNQRNLETQKTQIVLNFQTNGQKIEKVLYAKSEICVGEITKSNSTANVAGNVETHVLVKTQEEVIPLSSSSQFSLSFNSNLIDQDSKMWAEVCNLGIDNIIVNEISLSLTQKFSVEAFVLEKQKQNYVSSIAPANQKMELYELKTVENVLTENFDLMFELEFPNSCSKILSAESFAVSNNVQTSKDMLTVNGTLYTKLFYMSNDENPKLKQKLYTNDFNQEFLMSGTLDSCQGFAKFSVCKTNFDVDGEQSNEKGVISLTTNLKANIVTQSLLCFEAVVDAFCVKKEMQMDFSSFLSQNIVCHKTFNDKIDGNFVLQDQDARIDKIMFASANYVSVSKIQVADNDVILKGTANVQLAVFIDDEARTMKVEEVSIPFEISSRCDENLNEAKIFVKVNPKDVDARIKKSKEVDISLDVVVDLFVLEEKNQAVMSNLVVGEDRKQRQPNMGIYVVRDAEDLWDLSKKLLINPQILENQNPELMFPITKPTQIVVYRERTN